MKKREKLYSGAEVILMIDSIFQPILEGLKKINDTFGSASSINKNEEKIGRREILRR